MSELGVPTQASAGLLWSGSSVQEGGHRRGWLDRWLATCADLARLKDSHPMLDAVIDEIDGRMIRVGDQWLADFASCNYLGFDLEPEIIGSVQGAIDKWGTHPSCHACSAARSFTSRSRKSLWSSSFVKTPWPFQPSPTSTHR